MKARPRPGPELNSMFGACSATLVRKQPEVMAFGVFSERARFSRGKGSLRNRFWSGHQGRTGDERGQSTAAIYMGHCSSLHLVRNLLTSTRPPGNSRATVKQSSSVSLLLERFFALPMFGESLGDSLA